MAALVGLLGLVTLGCPRKDDSLILVGGATVDAATIDSDPLSVLPSGAIVIGQLDAQALFATSLGYKVGEIAANLLPLGAESNFVASRDVKRIYGATYTMQGADFCALLQGTFDVEAIRRAAQRSASTPSGVPIVQTSYGGNVLYTVANLGFAILTPNTILSGNETAMRRALDRLRVGKLEHSLAPWMHELFATQGAAFVLVGDLTGQGVVDAASSQLPFLAGLRLVRVLGNFRDPGTNVVGSLTYRDDAAATQGAQVLIQLPQMGGAILNLLAMFGFGPRIPALTVAQQGRDVAFSVSLEAATAALLLDYAVRATQPLRRR